MSYVLGYVLNHEYVLRIEPTCGLRIGHVLKDVSDIFHVLNLRIGYVFNTLRITYYVLKQLRYLYICTYDYAYARTCALRYSFVGIWVHSKLGPRGRCL